MYRGALQACKRRNFVWQWNQWLSKMDVRQTMIEAYRAGLRFDADGCGDTACDCNGLRIVVGGDRANPPDVELSDALAQHLQGDAALMDAWKLVVVSGWTYRRLMYRFGIAAITWPWGTLWVLPEFEHHDALRAHENEHMLQIERDGVWRFSVRYLWQLATKGYRNIDYEIEAYAVSGPISLLPVTAEEEP
jgi:hypothetical protein